MFTEIVIDGLRYEHRNDQKNETWDVYTNDELIGRLKLSGHRLTVSSLKDQGDKRQIMEANAPSMGWTTSRNGGQFTTDANRLNAIKCSHHCIANRWPLAVSAAMTPKVVTKAYAAYVHGCKLLDPCRKTSPWEELSESEQRAWRAAIESIGN